MVNVKMNWRGAILSTPGLHAGPDKRFNGWIFLLVQPDYKEPFN